MAKTVLAVDNYYQSTIRACREALQPPKYLLLTAVDAPEALRLLSEHAEIDLIVVESSPSGGNLLGHDVIAEAYQINPRLKSILTSATDKDTTSRMLDYLARRGIIAACLQKPIKPENLARLVEELLAE